MRIRVLLILVTTVLGVMLLGGVVLAVNKTCTNSCRGTNGSDSLTGNGRGNKIYGLSGDDYVAGGRGTDYLQRLS